MDTTDTLNVHVFTDVPAAMFEKQFPGGRAEMNGVHFTFGLEIPEPIDALILFNRASYSLRTSLPKERVAYIAAEPEAIHNYALGFLNQFGLVVASTQRELGTRLWRTAPCWYWFAGIDFSKPKLRGYDFFSQLEPPLKQDKIAVVTSNKVATDYHRKRVRFLDALVEKIPEHLDIYGRGYKSIDDKADALLPCKYHLALENSGGPDTWTEKLADPLLCWAFPFYAGADNLEDYFPAGSFSYLDLDAPEKAATQLVQAIESGLWERSLEDLRTAREIILEKENIAVQLTTVAKMLCAQPVRSTKNLFVRSERSMWPEKGTRGSFGQWALRNSLMLFDKEIELKTVELRKRLEARRSAKRDLKLAKLEDSRK